MKIMGNTVGTTMPRTDYNQTDSSKADYLKGKDDLNKNIADAKKAGTDAQTAANNAQTTANNAQTAAGNALTSAKTYTNEQVKKARPYNLLDNSDFRNPVNKSGELIDGWYVSNSNINATVDTGKITISKSNSGGDFGQKLPVDLTGKTVTAAMNTSQGMALISLVVSEASSFVKIGSLPAYLGVYAKDGETIFRIYFNDSSTVTLDCYWAALYEGEYTADTLPEYQPKGYMVEALNCGALTVHHTATLSASGWSSSAPYTQTVSVEGITADDTPHVSPVYSDTLATALLQKEAWEKVSRAKSSANSITFYCFEDKPTTDIPVQIEVNR